MGFSDKASGEPFLMKEWQSSPAQPSPFFLYAFVTDATPGSNRYITERIKKKIISKGHMHAA